jgi:hypothetical protein
MSLTEIFMSIAEAIRSKNGKTTKYAPEDMSDAIKKIPTNTSLDVKIQEEVTVTKNGLVTPSAGYDAMLAVYVDVPIPEGYIKPSGQLSVSENGSYPVAPYESVKVEVVSDEYDRFWDSYQKNGEPGYFMGAFAGTGWSAETFKPKYDIRPWNGQMLFWSSYMEEDLAQMLVDCGNKKIDLSQCFQIDQGFAYSRFTRIPELNMTNTGTKNVSMFNSCPNLVTIDKLIVSESNGFLAWFNECPKLTNLMIEGTIAQNDFDVSQSPLLTHDSLMSIIRALKDFSSDTSGTEHKVTLGETNALKLTSEERKSAKDKGWTIYPTVAETITVTINGTSYVVNNGTTWVSSGLAGEENEEGKPFYVASNGEVMTPDGSDTLHLGGREYAERGDDILVDGGEYVTENYASVPTFTVNGIGYQFEEESTWRYYYENSRNEAHIATADDPWVGITVDSVYYLLYYDADCTSNVELDDFIQKNRVYYTKAY